MAKRMTKKAKLVRKQNAECKAIYKGMKKHIIACKKGVATGAVVSTKEGHRTVAKSCARQFGKKTAFTVKVGRGKYARKNANAQDTQYDACWRGGTDTILRRLYQ